MPENRPLATIIIPTYNRKKLLDLTLHSILDQSINPKSLEVIVVDDGSADNTFEIIEKYRPLLRIRYFYQDDLGYRTGLARNIGLQHASSEICLLIDSGVLLGSNSVKAHLDFHKNNESKCAVIGYVYGFHHEENSHNVFSLKKWIEANKNIDKIIEFSQRYPRFSDIRENEYLQFSDKISSLPAPWAYFWTSNVSINVNSFEAGTPFFDKAFDGHYGWEDIDLGFRLHMNGIKFGLVREAAGVHYPHPKQKNFKNDYLINKKLFKAKHKSKIAQMFVENDGTFGFNELLLRKNVKVILEKNAQI